MGTSPANVCPACRLPHALKGHCHEAHPTCPWLRCTSCRIVYDPGTRRGFDREGQQLQLLQEPA